jgi:glutathione S-transferase
MKFNWHWRRGERGGEKMAATLKLTNNPVCPFGQRVWLTLEASGLAYTFQETSITKGEKPAWFTTLYGKAFGSDPSSDGKVPVLEDLSSSFILTESLHCADYVAALAPPETRLLPQAPQERARCGLFMEAAAKYIPPFYALMMKQQAEEQATARTALLAAMATLATVSGGGSSPGSALNSACHVAPQ